MGAFGEGCFLLFFFFLFIDCELAFGTGQHWTSSAGPLRSRLAESRAEASYGLETGGLLGGSYLTFCLGFDSLLANLCIGMFRAGGYIRRMLFFSRIHKLRIFILRRRRNIKFVIGHPSNCHTLELKFRRERYKKPDPNNIKN